MPANITPSSMPSSTCVGVVGVWVCVVSVCVCVVSVCGVDCTNYNDMKNFIIHF